MDHSILKNNITLSPKTRAVPKKESRGMEPGFLDQLGDIVNSISGVVWGVPMVALIMTAGLVLSIRNKFVQFRGLRHSAELISGSMTIKMMLAS